MSAKTPKTSSAPTSNGAPSAAKSANKPQQQPQQQQGGKGKQTPAKVPAKKIESEDDDDTDEDDAEEQKVFGNKKKMDPEDEAEEDEGEEDEEEEDDEDDEDYEDNVIDLTDRLRYGFQQGFCIPAGSSVMIQCAAHMNSVLPFHITNACLGPDAEDDDRACLTLLQPSVFGDDHDHDHDHEGEEHDHEHEDEEEDEDVMEIVCGILCKNKTENLALDLVITGDFMLSNTSNNTDVYVTGRILPPDDDEEDEDYDEEDLEMEDGDEEREDLEDDEEMDEDDEEEEEEDTEARNARAAEMRKRLLSASNGDTSKKAKVEPKVIDIKPAEKKPQAPAAKPATSEKKATGEAPKPEAVRDYILSELKAKKVIKSTDLGSMMVNKFGMSFKNMGFPEKTLNKFLEAHAKGKVEIAGDSVKIL